MIANLPVELTEMERLRQSIDRFQEWLESHGLETYDPYDIWGLPIGLFARKLYYRNQVLGAPLVLPILLLDTLFPGLRRGVLEKKRYATADGQIALAYLNLYRLTHETRWLEKSEGIAHEMLEYSVPGYRGPCWGYPFDWRNNKATWKAYTPFITCTPYGFELFLQLHSVTRSERYLEIAKAIARFVHDDLNDTVTSSNASAASYGVGLHDQVINASAYRAWVLVEASFELGLTAYLEKAQRNIQFILDAQNQDGSWPYGLTNSKEAFIDHFHTCFVLKNLFKINRHLQREDIRHAISKGHDYYASALFDENGLPRSFSVKPRFQIVKYDLYNFAETITLGCLLRETNPESHETAKRVARHVLSNYQLPDGYFVTKEYVWRGKHRFPFLRWSQAQLFLALTRLLMSMAEPTQPMSKATKHVLKFKDTSIGA